MRRRLRQLAENLAKKACIPYKKMAKIGLKRENLSTTRIMRVGKNAK